MNIRRHLDSYGEESRSRSLGSTTVRSARADMVGNFSTPCASDFLRCAANGDLNNRRARFAAELSACNVDLKIGPVSRPDLDWLARCSSGESLFGCAESQSALWTKGIVPMYENVQSPLDGSDLSAGQNQSPPEFERPEKPFDFSIKIGCPNSASHMPDTHFFGGLSERDTIKSCGRRKEGGVT